MDLVGSSIRLASGILPNGNGRVLAEHGGIWLLELQKFAVEHIDNEERRWLRFFKEGGQLDDETLPAWMNTEEMRQAMSTLKQFSDKERDYHAYQARQNFLREQRTIQWEREQDQLALQEQKNALQAQQQEIERLKALLDSRR